MSKGSKVIAGFVLALIALVLGVGSVVVHDTNNAPKTAVGAISTLESVDSPFVSIGGSKMYYYNQTIAATSSVACSIKNPLAATSTIPRYSVNVLTNGLGSQKFDISTSSTAVGSSTPSFVRAYSAGTGAFTALWESNGTTTNTIAIGNSALNTGQSDLIIGPNDYINFRIATGTPGTFSSYYTGSCTGVIVKL